jgi:O-antigen ligase
MIGLVVSRPEAPQTPEARLARTIGGVTSFETLFLLFVFAGTFKNMPELSWFPVDITLFFMALSLITGIVLWATREYPMIVLSDAGFVLYIIFLIWTVFSLIWSGLEDFNLEKGTRTATFISWCFLGSYLIVARTQERVARFVIVVMIISIAMLSYWAYYRFVLGVDPVTGATKAANYLTYGLYAAYLVAIIMSFAVASHNFGLRSTAALAIIAVFVLMLFMGGRGPLLWALFTVPLALLFLLLNRNARQYRTRFSSVLLAFAFVLGLIILVVSEACTGLVEGLEPEMTTVGRFQILSEEPDYGKSVDGRLRAQAFALESWSQAPVIGWGLGEFKHQYSYGGFTYPHNLFLEVLMEEGVVGFGLLTALMGLGLVRAWKLWPARWPQWPVIAAILLFIPLLMSRVTHQGFLPDERALFAFLGLILGLGHRSVERAGAA